MRIVFIGSLGVIVRDRRSGRGLYSKDLGLPLKKPRGGDFLYTQKLPGSRYFGVWPLSEAARACFGRSRWPGNRPVPQMFIEFEVGDRSEVASAARELRSRGHLLLHEPRTDPWGQTVVRFQTEDGLLVAVSYVPWMHRPQRKALNTKRRRRASPRR